MEEKTERKQKKLKGKGVDNIGEGGVEMEMVNGSKILGKGGEDVKGDQGNGKKDRKKSRDNLKKQDMGKESEARGIGREEVLDVSRNVGLEKDIDNVKMKKSKKNKGQNKTGKKTKKEGEAEGDVSRNVGLEKDIDSVKMKKSKKKKGQNEEGNKVRKEGEAEGIDGGEHVKVSKNVIVEKAEAKKKNKKDKRKGGSDHQAVEQIVEDVSLPSCGDIQDTKIVDREENSERRNKKRKREKKKDDAEDNVDASTQDTSLPDNATPVAESRNMRSTDVDGVCEKDVMKKARKKQKLKEKGKPMSASDCDNVNSDGTVNEREDRGKRKKPKLVESVSQGSKPGKSKKKVKFSNDIEVFPISDDAIPDVGNDKVVRGKRFSHEEDEIVMNAVHDYIKAHGLGDEGLNMVLNCRSHREVRNCWKEIGLALPYRPREAIYNRAQNLFRRSDTTKWTKEEYEMIREFQEKHGHQWKLLADELQKHRVHVKDTWRRIRYLNLKKGHWDQEEYQGLFDLVNDDLKSKFDKEKKSKHGMLRDNIRWTDISDKLSSRSDSNCCQKWYDQLTSSMVAEGEWADADDYRLINALYELDASCIEDVDWDMLLEHRPGEACRKRWNQMVLHLGYYGTRSFGEQVEVLAKRYCPDLIEFREAWDSKPVVP